jgi:hypothetical protein
VPDALLQGVRLPVVKLAPYTDERADADFENLSAIFSLPMTPTTTLTPPPGTAALNAENPPPPPLPTNTPFRVSISENQVLQLDTTSGLYEFSDLNQLWSAPTAEKAFATAAAIAAGQTVDAVIPGPAEARAFADRFLRANQLFDQGAFFSEVVADGVGNTDRGENLGEPEMGRLEVRTNYQVIYARQLPIVGVTAAGALPVTLTVVGPGAKLKVYVPQSVVRTAGLPDPLPAGVQGGWRDLEVANAVIGASANAPMMQALPADQVKALYLAMDSLVTMTSLPISISAQSVLSTSLAYWENSPGISQTEMIPVYQFDVEITDGNTGEKSIVQQYVPAVPTYLMPIAQILPSGATTAAEAVSAGVQQAQPLLPGQSLTLNAADASKTLAELGFGADFNFKSGVGPYKYEWYLGDPIPPNLLPSCTSTTCQLQVPIAFNDKGGQMFVNLVVTDLGNPNLSQATDSASFEVLPAALWLPTVERP